MTVATVQDYKVSAAVGATAWLNAALASGRDDARPMLYRTLLVEFFSGGVQFIGCDGTMLFRSWAPYSDVGFEYDQPDPDEAPEDSVVVMDVEKFALGFMRTLRSACPNDLPVDLSIAIEPDEDEQESFSEEMRPYVLTLSALGQQLSCRLYDGDFPDWRRLSLGLDPAELVDGMTLSPRILGAVGKLKDVGGVDCEFRGGDRAIEFKAVHGEAKVCGLLMPMRRPDKPKKANDGVEQTEHAAEAGT